MTLCSHGRQMDHRTVGLQHALQSGIYACISLNTPYNTTLLKHTAIYIDAHVHKLHTLHTHAHAHTLHTCAHYTHTHTTHTHYTHHTHTHYTHTT